MGVSNSVDPDGFSAFVNGLIPQPEAGVNVMVSGKVNFTEKAKASAGAVSKAVDRLLNPSSEDKGPTEIPGDDERKGLEEVRDCARAVIDGRTIERYDSQEETQRGLITKAFIWIARGFNTLFLRKKYVDIQVIKVAKACLEGVARDWNSDLRVDAFVKRAEGLVAGVGKRAVAAGGGLFDAVRRRISPDLKERVEQAKNDLRGLLGSDSGFILGKTYFFSEMSKGDDVLKKLAKDSNRSVAEIFLLGGELFLRKADPNGNCTTKKISVSEEAASISCGGVKYDDVSGFRDGVLDDVLTVGMAENRITQRKRVEESLLVEPFCVTKEDAKEEALKPLADQQANYSVAAIYKDGERIFLATAKLTGERGNCEYKAMEVIVSKENAKISYDGGEYSTADQLIEAIRRNYHSVADARRKSSVSVRQEKEDEAPVASAAIGTPRPQAAPLRPQQPAARPAAAPAAAAPAAIGTPRPQPTIQQPPAARPAAASAAAAPAAPQLKRVKPKEEVWKDFIDKAGKGETDDVVRKKAKEDLEKGFRGLSDGELAWVMWNTKDLKGVARKNMADAAIVVIAERDNKGNIASAVAANGRALTRAERNKLGLQS